MIPNAILPGELRGWKARRSRRYLFCLLSDNLQPSLRCDVCYRMNFAVDDRHGKPNYASSAKLKTRIFWLNFDATKVLLEDGQSGVDGGFEFQQFAGTTF